MSVRLPAADGEELESIDIADTEQRLREAYAQGFRASLSF